MQRAAWGTIRSSGSNSSISRKSRTRSSTDRCGGSSRSNSMNPVGLATVDLLGGGDAVGVDLLLQAHPLQRLPVLDRHDLDEQRQAGLPVLEDLRRPLAP